jgi:hypothetical protein
MLDEDTIKHIKEFNEEWYKACPPRDPDRKDRIIDMIRELWHTVPDQRLGQLIENYIIPSGDMRGAATCWLFYAEDDETEERLKKIIKKEEK